MNEEVFEKLDSSLIGEQVTVLDCTESTNRIVKEMAQQGAAEKTVVFAEHQTAGRGRLGRSFYSPAGAGLYFTILLRPKENAVDSIMLTIAAGVAVAEAVEQVLGIVLEIKWVNDLYLNRKKVCGILAEGAFDPDGKLAYCALGIGLNVFAPKEGYGPLDTIAGALTSSPKSGLRERLAKAILDRFFKYYPRLDMPTLLERYRARSYLQGKYVTVVRGEQRISGRVIGIGDHAELLLQVGNKVLSCTSGEVLLEVHT